MVLRSPSLWWGQRAALTGRRSAPSLPFVSSLGLELNFSHNIEDRFRQ
jgi:predicted alpha/beta superfamily hydrolase